MIQAVARLETVVLLRGALLLLAGGGCVVTAIELAAARHWNGLVQLVPWAALAVVTVALGLAAVRPSRARLQVARGLAAVVVAAALYGVVMHVVANYEAGPLDGVYGERWDAARGLTRVWWAATETVGPSPFLAPAVLAQLSLLVLLATVRHPLLARRA